MSKIGRPIKVDKEIESLFLDIQEKNNDKVIALLHEKGVDVTDSYKRTVLINTILEGNVELMTWCIKNGADINFQDKLGMAALHYCAQEGKVKEAKLLLKHGAEVDLKDENGATPLLTALLNWNEGKNEPMIKLLTKHGANPKIENKHGVTPYEIMGA